MMLVCVSFHVLTQDPDVVIDSEHAPLLRPPIHILQFGNRVHPYSGARACGTHTADHTLLTLHTAHMIIFRAERGLCVTCAEESRAQQSR